MSGNPFRELPAVSRLIDAARAAGCVSVGATALAELARDYLATVRTGIAGGRELPTNEIVTGFCERVIAFERPKLAPAINATGVIVHTNLGRAPVSAATAAAMADAAANVVALEIEPESNERGGRMREITALMRVLTGAEATLVVNNNAAAILLVLAAVAAGREVIVSRAEAVEIGGGFRIPDVLRQSGARLVDVGTANRTRVSDYADAITANTAVLLKVHPSNFAVSGFVSRVTAAELAPLSVERGVPIVEDLGSGAIVDTSVYGLEHEPTIAEVLAGGAAIVTASGDKLLGGPQAGIIAGREALVHRIAAHPLARAVRADKVTLAGVAATLRHYVKGEAETEIPVHRMLATRVESLRERAAVLVEAVEKAGMRLDIAECEAAIGGGSLPGKTLPSIAVRLEALRIDEVARQLRMGSPGVFGRIDEGKLWLDLRTVLPEQDAALARRLIEVAEVANELAENVSR